MNVPLPNLPLYDPAKDEPFPWEADVRAAIEELRAEKDAASKVGLCPPDPINRSQLSERPGSSLRALEFGGLLGAQRLDLSNTTLERSHRKLRAERESLYVDLDGADLADIFSA